MKDLRRALTLLTRRRVDHVAVVGGDLLAQPLGRMRQKIARPRASLSAGHGVEQYVLGGKASARRYMLTIKRKFVDAI